jgi:hypothetical protein
MTSALCFLAFTPISNNFGVAIRKAVSIRLGAEDCLEFLGKVAARKIAGKMPALRLRDCRERTLWRDSRCLCSNMDTLPH